MNERLNMKMTGRLSVLVVLVAALLAGCVGDPGTENMASFDRAYIPALLLTKNKETTGESVMAVKQLKLQWSVFQSRNPGLAEEGGETSRVGELIMSADRLINAGLYREAHAELEQVRKVLHDARADTGKVYFPDLLYDFDMVMQKIMLVSRSSRRVAQLMPEATRVWQKVSKAYISEWSFNFSRDKLKRIKKLIEKETGILEEISQAASSRKRKDVKKKIKELQENFDTIYRMFGNFEGASL